ncbi:transposase [Micromonospora sp. B9E7]|uniref:IS110 family transposase n=1 Tax=Micromonospora sp. B9E7 TaxID=3153574 RepID=UPI00325F321B
MGRVDVGKTHHHVCVVDDDGTVVLSEKIPNDQQAISGIVGRLGKRRKPIRWAVDLRGGPASLLLAVLFDRGADVRYVSGTVTSRMAEAFHGERKTDAHDAYVQRPGARRSGLRDRRDGGRITLTSHLPPAAPRRPRRSSEDTTP